MLAAHPTLRVRVEGHHGDAELAQADRAERAGVDRVELAPALGALEFKLGYEELGSNAGLYGLQTPLATLHAFNGWADKFLVTPVDIPDVAAFTLGRARVDGV